MNPADATSESKPRESSPSIPSNTQPSKDQNSIPFPSIDLKYKMTSYSSDQKEFSLNSYSNVVKLSTGTFNDWKLRLTTVLGAQKLSKYILKDLDVPTDPTELENHETNLLRALAAIHSTIDDENFQVIRSFNCPKKAFQALCKHHDDAGGLSTAHLFSDLVTLRLNPDESLSDHLAKFRKIHNDLLSNLASTPDFKISEPFIAVILIKSLPSEYTPLVQTLLASFETLTLTRLYSLLKIEATRNSANNSSDTALSANRSKQKPRFGKKNDRPITNTNSSLKCSLSHLGHTDENCRTRRYRAFLEHEKNNPSSTSNHATSFVSASTSQSIPEANEDVSYWESVFSATISSDLQHTRPTRIGVASQDGAIWASHKGTVRHHH